MCVRVIGDKSRLAPDIQEIIARLEDATSDCSGLHFQVALNYGSQDEILRAVNCIIDDTKNGKIEGPVTKEVFESYLDTKGLPAPDLLIRTSGEQRLSNFLLWQLAYSEFYFTDIHWPDFSAEELEKAIEAYNKRDRRYGGVKE
jgi:undecaprenyl diphosphate synthase